MPQRQSAENRHSHRLKMLPQQINDGECIARMKSCELADGDACKAGEMPCLAEHRQLSVNLSQIHVGRFEKEDCSVQRWKSPAGGGCNRVEVAAQQYPFRHA